VHTLCDPVLLRDVRTAEHLGDDAQAGADAGRHIHYGVIKLLSIQIISPL
jgi:hypothetical protein